MSWHSHLGCEKSRGGGGGDGALAFISLPQQGHLQNGGRSRSQGIDPDAHRSCGFPGFLCARWRVWGSHGLATRASGPQSGSGAVASLHLQHLERGRAVARTP